VTSQHCIIRTIVHSTQYRVFHTIQVSSYSNSQLAYLRAKALSTFFSSQATSLIHSCCFCDGGGGDVWISSCPFPSFSLSYLFFSDLLFFSFLLCGSELDGLPSKVSLCQRSSRDLHPKNKGFSGPCTLRSHFSSTRMSGLGLLS